MCHIDFTMSANDLSSMQTKALLNHLLVTFEQQNEWRDFSCRANIN